MKTVDLGTELMADYVFLSKYSQRKEDGNLETWNETIDRIYGMHELMLKKLGLHSSVVSTLLEKAKKLEYNKVILSSQRGRQFASSKETDGILKHEAKMYNCSSTLIDRTKVFSEMMYLLLCGCGVGYSLHKSHIDKLPKVKEPLFTNHHIIEDSIEGWAEAVNVLMNGIFGGYNVEFDFTEIRAKGELINGKFLAPGSGPLRKAFKDIMEVVKVARGRKLTSLEIHDILCFIAQSVVSGGVRRSAMIALFDKSDYSMLTCKTGNWWEENPQRAMANNSILNSYEDMMSYSELKDAVKVIQQFGEPGIINVVDYNHTLNPCAEIVMNPVTDKGVSGFAFCNLVEINAEKIKNEKDFYDACELASFVATIQALYTDFKYLSNSTKEIAERDRAIGVSITGIMANKLLVGDVLANGAEKVVKVNKSISNLFNINPSKRCTTIKPSGNASAILGLYCSGIHAAHDYKFLRRIRVKSNSPEYKALIDTPMVKLLRGDEGVISFPIEIQDKSIIIKDNISSVEHLKYIGMVKHYWVNKGIIPGDIPNNVSATVEVKQDEWDDVASCLFLNDHLYTGVSLLPSFGDQVYDNAPFQRLIGEEVIKEYDDIMKYITENEVNFLDIMSSREDLYSGDMAAIGCSGGSCELK